MFNYEIKEPKRRGYLRRAIGKKIFILKRKLEWLRLGKSFARERTETLLGNVAFTHRSPLLRPLKGVDMYLQYNKITNLQLAIKQINKITIKPGQVLSVWKLIGKPTKRKGYVSGLVLENGRISTGIGGGLCQLGNLIYWMALHTPLTIKERYRHGYDVFPDINREIPFACGATLAYNYIDLQLRNDTDQSFQLHLWIDEQYLYGELRCERDLNLRFDIFETDHLFHQQWWGGYTRHNKIWKRIRPIDDNPGVVELVSINNAIMMYEPLIER